MLGVLRRGKRKRKKKGGGKREERKKLERGQSSISSNKFFKYFKC